MVKEPVSATSAARRLLAEKGRIFFMMSERVLADPAHEAVHDLRVAARRFREALLSFSACGETAKAELLARRLRKIVRLLGKLRNLDETRAFLLEVHRENPHAPGTRGIWSLAETLAGKRRRKAQAVGEAICGTMPEGLRESPGEVFAVTGGEDGGQESDFRQFARDFLGMSGERVLELAGPALPVEATDARHRLRVAVKRFRYRLELAGELVPEHFPLLHSRVRRYQEVLGRMNDLEVFDDFLSRGSDHPRGRALAADTIRRRRALLYRQFVDLVEEDPPARIVADVREALV